MIGSALEQNGIPPNYAASFDGGVYILIDNALRSILIFVGVLVLDFSTPGGAQTQKALDTAAIEQK